MTRQPDTGPSMSEKGRTERVEAIREAVEQLAPCLLHDPDDEEFHGPCFKCQQWQPLLNAAADYLALASRVEELEGALRKIAIHDATFVQGMSGGYNACRNIARTALEEKP